MLAGLGKAMGGGMGSILQGAGNLMTSGGKNGYMPLVNDLENSLGVPKALQGPMNNAVQNALGKTGIDTAQPVMSRNNLGAMAGGLAGTMLMGNPALGAKLGKQLATGTTGGLTGVGSTLINGMNPLSSVTGDLNAKSLGNMAT